MKNWTCDGCGELHDSQFDSCWKCGAVRPVDSEDLDLISEAPVSTPTTLPPSVSAVSQDRSMWYSQIIANMRKKSSEELMNILEKRDTDEWSEEAFLAAQEVLAEQSLPMSIGESVASRSVELPVERPVERPVELPESFTFEALPQLTEQTYEPSTTEDSPMEIFIAKREQRTGPFTVQQIETMISSGMVDLGDMAWHSNLLDWAPLHQILGVCPPVPKDEAAPPKIAPPKETPKNPKPKSKDSGLPARFGLRLVAIIIDNLVLIPLNFAVVLAVLVATNASEDSIIIVWNISGIFIGLMYFSIMESSPKMATLGKMAMGLIVVDYKGKRLSFDKATSRWAGKFISALTLGIGFLMPLWTKKKQCLHDFIASTLVIHK